jgi:hypothetical protein
MAPSATGTRMNILFISCGPVEGLSLLPLPLSLGLLPLSDDGGCCRCYFHRYQVDRLQ